MDVHPQNRTAIIIKRNKILEECILIDWKNNLQEFSTWGITSLTDSLINFSGEPKFDGVVLVLFIERGDPDVLLGERGGALPTGNIEGKELNMVAFEPLELPEIFREIPLLASSIKVFTYKRCKIKKVGTITQKRQWKLKSCIS